MSSNPAGSASGASITQAPSGNRSAGRSAASSMVNSTSVSIPGTAAAGGIQMVQPVSTVTTYYKIAPSDNITFKWNLTSLYVQPKSITVRAYCPTLSATFPVGPIPTGNNPNMSLAGVFPGNTTEVVWNPYEWTQMTNQPAQLIMATYALRIWDERGEGASQNLGGYLAPYIDKTKFALYYPASATPYDQWTCPTCSGYLSISSPSTLPVIMSVLIIFFSAWGLLRRDL